ncbi:MAG: hypothetical protein OXG16_12715 [Rhodospirillales bacterium]|nr:hypothetical protein [Rhodospirillales bacterium]
MILLDDLRSGGIEVDWGTIFDAGAKRARREFEMVRRRIGQKVLFPRECRRSSLDEIADLID